MPPSVKELPVGEQSREARQIAAALLEVLEDYRVKLLFSPPRTPRYNGTAEVGNRWQELHLAGSTERSHPPQTERRHEGAPVARRLSPREAWRSAGALAAARSP